MKILISALILTMLMAGCASDMFLVGIDPDPKGPAEVYFIPTQAKKQTAVPKDTSQSQLDAFVSGMEKASIKKFGDISNRYTTPLINCDEDFAFEFCDWNSDGIQDMVAINRQGFKATDMYILSGATEYKGFLLQQPIGLPYTDQNTDFAMADANRDGTPDLYVFSRRIGQLKDTVHVEVLSGRIGIQGPPFFTTLWETDMLISDRGRNKTFEVKDLNYDTIPDLAVIDKYFIENGGKGKTRVSVYSGKSQFSRMLRSPVIISEEKSTNTQFLLHDFLVKDTPDLIAIDKRKTGSSPLTIFRGSNGFKDILTRDSLKLPAPAQDAAFFGTDELPQLQENLRKPDFTYNPYPILREGSGPKNLSTYVGKWEMHGYYHSADRNDRTAIVIEELPAPQAGVQGISLTFEDGFVMKFIGEKGNVKCIQPENRFTLTKIENHHFYLIDQNGYHLKVDRYLKNMNKGFILVHNGSSYGAHVSASWTELGFGGVPKDTVTDTDYVPGVFHYDRLFEIPADAINIQISFRPDGPNAYTFLIEVPRVDNGCYQLIGTLLNPDYNRDCKKSRVDNMRTQALNIQKGKLVTELSKQIGNLIQSGQLSSSDIDPNDPKSRERVRQLIITPQIQKILDSKGSGITMVWDSINYYCEKLNLTPDQEILLVSSDASLFYNPYLPYPEVSLNNGQISAMSIGIGGSAQLLFGFAADIGGVFDLGGENHQSGYFSIAWSVGISAGAEAGLVISIWTPTVSEMEQGDGNMWGIELDLDIFVGLGIIVWFDYSGTPRFQGVSFLGGAGFDDALQYVRSHTNYFGGN